VGGAAALGCSARSNVDEFLNEITARIHTQSASFAVTGDSHSASLSTRRLCKFQTARREFLFDKGRPRLEGERSLSERDWLYPEKRSAAAHPHSIALISVNFFKCARSEE
jgi:hypothetical protein